MFLVDVVTTNKYKLSINILIANPRFNILSGRKKVYRNWLMHSFLCCPKPMFCDVIKKSSYLV